VVNDDRHDYLLEALEALTKPRTTRVMQGNDAGITCISTLQHEPLIAMLRNAIAGATGSKGGSSDGALRIPINPAALKLYDEIWRTSGEWFTALTREPIRASAELNLSGWFLAFRDARGAGDVTGEIEREHTRQLSSWVRQITGLFDPMVVVEVTTAYREPITDAYGKPKVNRKGEPRVRKTTRPAECPECGERFAFDRSTGDRITALVIEYRETGEETLDTAVATCRYCGATWEGNYRIRMLSYQIDEREKEIASRA